VQNWVKRPYSERAKQHYVDFRIMLILGRKKTATWRF
jgi:hypothetical protein